MQVDRRFRDADSHAQAASHSRRSLLLSNLLRTPPCARRTSVDVSGTPRVCRTGAKPTPVFGGVGIIECAARGCRRAETGSARSVRPMSTIEADSTTQSPFQREVTETQQYIDSPRFEGITRPYTPGQAVTMKRMGIEGIYLGGWATSAKGSINEDPGPDLASYPLSQVPEEAAGLVRALLTADRNQQYLRVRMTEQQRAASPAVDYRPFIIADADTGHRGDPHVRNLIRRFVESGVPGYHIEDQRPGTKKCGHQGGKVLVPSDEQLKRLNTARFQLDIMGVPGIIVARTDAEAANLIEGRGDERDQPFLIGATNPNVPAYKPCFLALIQHLHELGVTEVTGHLLYAISVGEHTVARDWLERRGILAQAAEAVASLREGKETSVDAMFDRITTRFLDAWEDDAELNTFGEAVAEVIEFRSSEGEPVETS